MVYLERCEHMNNIHSSSLTTLLSYGSVESGTLYELYECPCQQGHIEASSEAISICCQVCQKRYKVQKGLYLSDFDLVEK